jgi:serine/threonine-protein kinase
MVVDRRGADSPRSWQAWSVRTEQVLDGRYRLDARLGAGGMSVVWRAHDLVLDREVAVKVLAGTAAASPAARERVRSEAQAAARLWHPHVTNVYDYGESPGDDGAPVPYVVMELLPGRTLSDRLAEGPLSAPSALRTLAEVAAALAAAHAQNVVHRDVKPSNVMLTPTGAKVVDFGIAAVVGSAELDGDGLLLGTPAYLAPERLTAGQVTAASDVYALGLLIHRVLTNRLPWLAETTTAMLKAHVYAEPAPLPPVEGVPTEVNELCDRCLAKEPSDRPTAAEAAAILAEAAGIVPPPSDDGPPAGWAAALDGRTTSTVPPADNRATVDTARRRRRNLLAAGAAVLVAAIAVIALATATDEPSGGAASPDPGSSGGSGSPGASAGAGSPGAAASGRPGAGTAPTSSAGGGAVPLDPGASPGAGAGPTAGAAPGPQPGATATTTRPAPPPGGLGVPIVTLGGVVTVRCIGGQAEVVGLQREPGYETKDYDPGPAQEVQVVLISPLNEMELKVRCAGGVPLPEIKNSEQ